MPSIHTDSYATHVVASHLEPASDFASPPARGKSTAIFVVALLHVVMFYAFTHGMKVVQIFKPLSDPLLVQTAPPERTKPVPQPVDVDPRLPTTVVDTLNPTPQLKIQDEPLQFNNEVGLSVPGGVPGGMTDPVGEGPVVPQHEAALSVLRRVDPVYPASARRAGEQGTVVLSVMVDADGHVSAATVMRSSGSMDLDDAALAAIKRWKFSARSAGTHQVHVPITFRLDTVSF